MADKSRLPAKPDSLLSKPALTWGEKLIIVIRSAMQAWPPGIGSAIETLYFGTADARRLKKLEAFLEEVRVELSRIDHVKIDEAFFQSDDFAYFFEGTLRRIQTEASEAKLKALSGILVSIIVDQPFQEFDKKSSFLRTIDFIETTHLQILQLLASKWPLPGAEDDLAFLSRKDICITLHIRRQSDVEFLYSALERFPHQ